MYVTDNPTLISGDTYVEMTVDDVEEAAEMLDDLNYPSSDVWSFQPHRLCVRVHPSTPDSPAINLRDNGIKVSDLLIVIHGGEV